MTTFYRTPDIIIDAHEWHVVVWKKRGRVMTAYRWRPVAARTHRWLSIVTWRGDKPKALWRYFLPFRRHVAVAMGCDSRRAAAVARLRGRLETGAAARNVGQPRADLTRQEAA